MIYPFASIRLLLIHFAQSSGRLVQYLWFAQIDRGGELSTDRDLDDFIGRLRIGSTGEFMFCTLLARKIEYE